VDKVIGQMEVECDKKLAACKEESRQQLICVQEEHAAFVNFTANAYFHIDLSSSFLQYFLWPSSY